MKAVRNYFPHALLAAYLIVFAWLGIEPYDRAVWYVENIPIFGIALILTILYVRGIRFSNLSYALMATLIFWHTVGGHYTFERVPFDWFNDFFGFERNMYDRIGHFTVGFYAYPILELLDKYRAVANRVVLYLFPLFAIAAVAMSYELIEWIYAAYFGDPAAGAAFLGSQGDIWDAQKDMAADTLGAVFSLVLYAIVNRRPPMR